MNADTLNDLKAALKERGWTQELIAEELGRSQSHICHVLLGNRQSMVLLDQLRALTERDAPKPIAVP